MTTPRIMQATIARASDSNTPSRKIDMEANPTYAPTMYTSPWAKLMSWMMPYTIV